MGWSTRVYNIHVHIRTCTWSMCMITLCTHTCTCTHLHAKCMDTMHACICNNSRQSKGKHSSRHLISEKRPTFSIIRVHVHTLCIMHVRTCSTQVCVHNTSHTQCACSSMKSVCKCIYTCNSCLMVFEP